MGIHMEYFKGSVVNLPDLLQRWVHLGKAKFLLEAYAKVIRALTPHLAPEEVNKTIRMNYHGQRLQASVGMLELWGLHDPNGMAPWDSANFSRWEVILHQKQSSGSLCLYLLQKWGSAAWQVTFANLFREEVGDLLLALEPGCSVKVINEKG